MNCPNRAAGIVKITYLAIFFKVIRNDISAISCLKGISKHIIGFGYAVPRVEMGIPIWKRARFTCLPVSNWLLPAQHWKTRSLATHLHWNHWILSRGSEMDTLDVQILVYPYIGCLGINPDSWVLMLLVKIRIRVIHIDEQKYSVVKTQPLSIFFLPKSGIYGQSCSKLMLSKSRYSLQQFGHRFVLAVTTTSMFCRCEQAIMQKRMGNNRSFFMVLFWFTKF